jgi:hypothetical protein
MCLLAVCATAIPSRITSAQTVYVDVTPGHATNHFIPSQTLGAGIDRIPTNAIDQTLNNPATLKQVLSAGWQPVTYRQNTDLQVEAWHWNPTGTWSDPSKKQGYFTGSPTPAGFIRYSYGYALPHRGDDSGSGYSRLTDGDTSTSGKATPTSPADLPRNLTPCIPSGRSSTFAITRILTPSASTGLPLMPLAILSSTGPEEIPSAPQPRGLG